MNLHHKQKQIRSAYGNLKKPLIIKNTDYIIANAFAFYSLNGNSFITFKDCSKSEYICGFLEKNIQNKGKIVILILDNSKTYHATKTVTKAKKLGIILVFLPPYSPDLNPVEFVWKTIKREVSIRFIQSKEHLKNSIKNEFVKVKKSLSFAKKWMETFNLQIKSVIC